MRSAARDFQCAPVGAHREPQEREQAGGREDLRAQFLLARLPFGEGLISPGCEVCIGVGDIGVAGILRGNLAHQRQACGTDSGKQTRHV